MPYFNLKNPHDRIPSPWISISKEDKPVEEINVNKPFFGNLWDKITQLQRSLDAGKVQKLLEKNGLKICHDDTHSPNGVSCSTAGMMVVFQDDPTEQERTKFLELIKEIADNINDYLIDVGSPGEMASVIEEEPTEPRLDV